MTGDGEIDGVGDSVTGGATVAVGGTVAEGSAGAETAGGSAGMEGFFGGAPNAPARISPEPSSANTVDMGNFSFLYRFLPLTGS